MDVAYSPTFLRMLKSLSPYLQEEAFKKIELFKQPRHHKMLKVHKLKGQLDDQYSFSINYQNRIVFFWLKSGPHRTAYLTAIGDHDIYR